MTISLVPVVMCMNLALDMDIFVSLLDLLIIVCITFIIRQGVTKCVSIGINVRAYFLQYKVLLYSYLNVRN